VFLRVALRRARSKAPPAARSGPSPRLRPSGRWAVAARINPNHRIPCVTVRRRSRGRTLSAVTVGAGSGGWPAGALELWDGCGPGAFRNGPRRHGTASSLTLVYQSSDSRADVRHRPDMRSLRCPEVVAGLVLSGEEFCFVPSRGRSRSRLLIFIPSFFSIMPVPMNASFHV